MQLRLINARVSFKRKKKPQSSLWFSRILSTGAPTQEYSAVSLPTARSRKFRAIPSDNNSEISLTIPVSQAGDATLLNDVKDNGPMDWYLEGPGRRVAYDDLTAIDWIFEYTKERLRLRLLNSGTQGIFGYAQQLFDASQIWLILIGTGLASGIIAAGIDLASSWLSDLKTGYCRAGTGGGQFYLNKGFCCWGLEGNLKESGEENSTDKLKSISAMSRLDFVEQCASRWIKSRHLYCRIQFLHLIFGITEYISYSVSHI